MERKDWASIDRLGDEEGEVKDEKGREREKRGRKRERNVVKKERRTGIEVKKGEQWEV